MMASFAHVCLRMNHCMMLFSCCSGNCKCNGACANKPFQLRPIKKLKVVKTEKCGFGLVAEEDIKQGEFVIEYVGEGGVDLMLLKRKRALTKDCIQSLVRVWRHSHKM